VQDPKLGPLPTEIWLLSKIQHPNIADLLEYFEDDVYYYLVRSMNPEPPSGVAQLSVERFKSFMVLLGSAKRASRSKE
jgi:hypothetical protein